MSAQDFAALFGTDTESMNMAAGNATMDFFDDEYDDDEDGAEWD